MTADELRNCPGELLGSGIPEASSDSEPLRFFRQWLAERNLGLVPIADPASFDWAGKWIAVIDGSDARHAVVMFGSPSGVWHDPASAYTEGARILAGWMLTPLDLDLPTHTPYGTAAGARSPPDPAQSAGEATGPQGPRAMRAAPPPGFEVQA